jgi:hypothetical protein
VNCFSVRKAAKAKAIAEGLISASILIYQRTQKCNFASLSRKNKRAEADRCVLTSLVLSVSRQKERTKDLMEKQESEDRSLRLAPITIGVLFSLH